MKKLFFATILSAASVAATAAVLIFNADFSGTWSFNEGKSKLAEGRFRMNATTLKVTGDANGLSIDRTSTPPQGDPVTSTEKITFDGKPSESTGFRNSKKVSTAKWSADGKELTISATTTFEGNGQTFELKSTEVWKLSEDGKTLTLDVTSTSPRGETKNTFVYDKK
jgi:hypothetical protein